MEPTNPDALTLQLTRPLREPLATREPVLAVVTACEVTAPAVPLTTPEPASAAACADDIATILVMFADWTTAAPCELERAAGLPRNAAVAVAVDIAELTRAAPFAVPLWTVTTAIAVVSPLAPSPCRVAVPPIDAA
jgi:hypothetical protein